MTDRHSYKNNKVSRYTLQFSNNCASHNIAHKNEGADMNPKIVPKGYGRNM